MWYPGRESPLWALSFLALGGGVRMAISRPIRATCVALETYFAFYFTRFLY